VVFPDPPFWFTAAMIFAGMSGSLYGINEIYHLYGFY